MAQLLTIVEVPEADKVRCRAEGCGRGVWRRIHVVEVDGQLTVMGSDCFAKLFGSSEDQLYGNPGQHRELSPEERHLMETNTEAFVELMRDHYAAELEEAMRVEQLRIDQDKERARQMAEMLAAPRPSWAEEQSRRAAEQQERERIATALAKFNEGRRRAMEVEVRREFATVLGVDVSLPGWAGWFAGEVKRWMKLEIEAGHPVEWPGIPLSGPSGRRFSREKVTGPERALSLGDGPDWRGMADRQAKSRRQDGEVLRGAPGDEPGNWGDQQGALW